MPALHHSNIQRRTDSGTKFTIILALVAFIVVAGCAAWGYFYPRWRKRYPPPPSRTIHNDGPLVPRPGIPGLITTIPSHPVVSFVPPARSVPIYDPRTETPFPSTPASHDVELPPYRQRIKSSPCFDTSSNGLFSPSTNRDLSRVNCNRIHTAVSEKVRDEDGINAAPKSSDFGDAKDFILAIPEPLKARSEGQAPPLDREMNKFPLSNSSPTNPDKLLHPKVLLQRLGRNIDRSSQCSSTSLRIDHRDSDEANQQSNIPRMVEDTGNQGNTKTKRQILGGNRPPTPRPKVDDADCKDGMTAIHRLHSYRSLTGASIGKPKLVRAGTLTRPKTPVEEMRKLYDGNRKVDCMPTGGLTYDDSLTTIPYGRARSSTCATSSTAPSSPRAAESILQLLPTPLHVKHSVPDSLFSTSAVDLDLKRKSSVTIPVHNLQLSSSSYTLKSKRAKRQSRGFYHKSRKSRPPPLKLKSSVRVLSSPPHGTQRLSLTSVRTSMIAPLVKSHHFRRSFRGSSIYSRDTKGMSIAHTPISPGFPTPLVRLLSDTPKLRSGVKEDGPRQALSKEEIENEKSEIHLTENDIGEDETHFQNKDSAINDNQDDNEDEWQDDDTPIEEIELDNAPSSAFKRALSNFSMPKSSAPHPIDHEDIESNASSQSSTGEDLATFAVSNSYICYRKSNEDIFKDISTPKTSTHVSIAGNSISTRCSMGSTEDVTAPGGANWI